MDGEVWHSSRKSFFIVQEFITVISMTGNNMKFNKIVIVLLLQFIIIIPIVIIVIIIGMEMLILI